MQTCPSNIWTADATTIVLSVMRRCQRRTEIASAGRGKNAARLLADRVLWLAARMADLLGRAGRSSPKAP